MAINENPFDFKEWYNKGLEAGKNITKREILELLPSIAEIAHLISGTNKVGVDG